MTRLIRKNFIKGTIITVLCTIFLSTGSLYARKDEKQTGDGTLLRVHVSIPPLAYFVERIGAEHVSVETLIDAGNDPHTYEPTPRMMMALSETDVYFSTGMPFEKQLLDKIKGSNPLLVIIETDKDSAKNTSSGRNEQNGDIGNIEESEHDKYGGDPHIWLSPFLIKIQAENILMGLVKLDPENSESYEENYRSFIGELDVVHGKISKSLGPYSGRSFMVFHPAFGHFADAYGLVQIAIEIEGRDPSSKQLEKVIKRSAELDIKTIFIEPQFDRKNAEVVADSINAKVVSLDPLRKNVLENLELIAKAVEKSF
jgi:zinc transport system substrate-binding protein